MSHICYLFGSSTILHKCIILVNKVTHNMAYLGHCNTLLHIATHCTTLRHTVTLCNTPKHTATHWHKCARGTTLKQLQLDFQESKNAFNKCVCIVLQCIAVCCSVLQCVVLINCDNCVTHTPSLFLFFSLSLS